MAEPSRMFFACSCQASHPGPTSYCPGVNGKSRFPDTSYYPPKRVARSNIDRKRGRSSDISQITSKLVEILPRGPPCEVVIFLLQPSDSSDLVISPCLEGYTPTIPSLQTYLSCHFHRAVYFLGLHGNRASS